jgi:hypothetical protein
LIFVKISPEMAKKKDRVIHIPVENMDLPESATLESVRSAEAYIYCDELNHSSARGVATLDVETGIVFVNVQWQTMIENAY